MSTVSTATRMRAGAELLGERYTSGIYTALITDGLRFSRIQITLTLRPGHSGQDHLFDRTLAQASALIAEHECWISTAEARRWLDQRLDSSCGGYDLRVTDLHECCEYEDVSELAKQIARDENRRRVEKTTQRFRRARATQFRALTVEPLANDRYAMTTPDGAYGLNRDVVTGHWSVCSPYQTFASVAEALAARADALRSVGAETR